MGQASVQRRYADEGSLERTFSQDVEKLFLRSSVFGLERTFVTGVQPTAKK